MESWHLLPSQGLESHLMALFWVLSEVVGLLRRLDPILYLVKRQDVAVAQTTFYRVAGLKSLANHRLKSYHTYKVWCRGADEGLCHDLAKWLSHYLYFFSFLFFSFILDLLHRGKCGKVSHHKCHTVMVTWQEVIVSHHIMSHDESHDRHGKIVHRPCSSCISSVENLTGTLSSSPCQTLIKEQLA